MDAIICNWMGMGHTTEECPFLLKCRADDIDAKSRHTQLFGRYVHSYKSSLNQKFLCPECCNQNTQKEKSKE